MAYEDKVRPGAKPQRITMEERARLTVTGVEEVLSFDTERIVMRTVLGELTVTGSDQDNLVACQVARDHFHAKKVISRVNDPRNIETFQVLGIGNTACSTEILTKMIEQEADLAHMHLIATLNQGKAGICSMTLPSNTALDGVALKDIDLPGGTLVISLIRRGVLTIPNGSTTLQAGDELVAVSEERSQKALMRALAETVR